MFISREWFKRFLAIIFVGFLVFSVSLSQPALGESNQCVLQPNAAWQNKFPLGFITGTFPESNYFSKCPKFNLFGYDYEVCTIKTLLETLKNVVLLKFIITSLQNL